MDPDFRKVALVAASLGLIVSVFFALRPTDHEPATTVGDRGPGTVHIGYRIEGGAPLGGIARDSVARGRVVVLGITSDVPDRVHVHGYDLIVDVRPGATATIRFTAASVGRFEVELEDRGVRIAELEIRS